ncbi:MAG: orotidine-5'-phosphate decarboxylase [Bacteroidales bacterium]
MERKELIDQIFLKKSFLCVGLDTDINKIPEHLASEKDPVFSFNKAIIDATSDFAVAYKPNIAFYESMGKKGWESLEKTISYINSKFPSIFTIADAKRGDIGNTANMYAKAFLDNMNFDAVTLNPYMGSDSIMPFLEKEGKWAVILALTSNKSAEDFQYLPISDKNTDTPEYVFEAVIKKSLEIGNDNNIMFVVGATKAEKLKDIRRLAPDSFLLVPGVGAQGGSLEEVAKYGMNKDCGLLINASRSIIYAGNNLDFADKARNAAEIMQKEMQVYLKAI